MSVYTLAPGKYYIGDPSYVFDSGNWDKVMAAGGDFVSSEPFLYGGLSMWVAYTANGDGEYEDQNGNKYPVDAAVLGAVPIELVENPEHESFGAILDAPRGLEVCLEDGVFRFNQIVIDTDADTHFGSLDGGYDLDPEDDDIF